MPTATIEPTEVIVRDASLDDVAALVALLVGGSLSPEAEDATDLSGYHAALIGITEDPMASVVVCEVDGVVVAMAQLFMFRHLQHRGGLCAEVESVHVRRDLQGLGIGTIVMSAAMARAQAAGCYRIQLTSNLERADAHRFYEKLGFSAYHRGFKLTFSR